jgi:LysM repeat protein
VGVLRLARREYAESLDALLRSGFWMDAAYVAERVLTLDELKSYVDRNWPAVATTNAAPAEQERPPVWPLNVRREIRYLLARRLTRMERGNEAFEYYPAEQQADFLALVEKLRIEGNGETSTNDRADALFAAARIVRNHGMELIGTEVEPDWHVHGGDYDEGVTVASRVTNEPSAVLVASQNELRRAQEHGVVPDARFHYRYEAAALAWEAAGLMPDNADLTARVLCTAGTWLKNRTPEMADVFYKSLVRRCRKTDIGELADRMRWFPDLDENGNPVPWTPEPPEEVEVTPSASDNPTAPGPGYWYVLHRGNTLQDVVEAVKASRQLTVTIEEIQNANPGAHPNRLKAGQKIFVPAPEGSVIPSPTPLAVPPSNNESSPEIPAPGNESGMAIESVQDDDNQTYTIRSGDSLFSIAHEFGCRVSDLLALNPELQEISRLKVGQKLRKP